MDIKSENQGRKKKERKKENIVYICVLIVKKN